MKSETHISGVDSETFARTATRRGSTRSAGAGAQRVHTRPVGVGFARLDVPSTTFLVWSVIDFLQFTGLGLVGHFSLHSRLQFASEQAQIVQHIYLVLFELSLAHDSGERAIAHIGSSD